MQGCRTISVLVLQQTIDLRATPPWRSGPPIPVSDPFVGQNLARPCRCIGDVYCQVLDTNIWRMFQMSRSFRRESFSMLSECRIKARCSTRGKTAWTSINGTTQCLAFRCRCVICQWLYSLEIRAFQTLPKEDHRTISWLYQERSPGIRSGGDCC
jgi:hypothetical protein